MSEKNAQLVAEASTKSTILDVANGLIGSFDVDALLTRIAEAALRSGPRPAILGAHLEGPFLGGAPGAHRVDHLRPLDPGVARDQVVTELLVALSAAHGGIL